MQIITLPEEDEALAEHLWQGRGLEFNQKRASGWHVSGLITDYMSLNGLIRWNNSGPPDEVGKLRMMMGFVWEDIVGDFMAIRASPMSQLALKYDGIHATLDAFGALDAVLEEYKATWKSEEAAMADAWRWFMQVKVYLYIWDMVSRGHAVKEERGWYLARLRVLYVCPTPRTVTYKLVFEPQEVVEAWGMVDSQRRLRESQGDLSKMERH